MKSLPTIQRLRQLFSYDPENGDLWRLRNRRAPGPCRVVDSSGRIQVSVDGRLFLAHRIAWAMMTGEWPTIDVDHINRSPLDNRWLNLRLATRAQNCANSLGKSRRKLASKGVSKKRNRFRATICKEYKQYHLGYFDTEEEASLAYTTAAKQLNGNFVPMDL